MNVAAASHFQRSRPSDPALDYCLWPYSPPSPPVAGGLRSSALLFHSFEVAGLLAPMARIAQHIRGLLGPFATVWGVKWDGERLSWEFYVYDYARLGRRVGTNAFARGMREVLAIDVPLDDQRPYFMFSIELGAAEAQGAPLRQVDIYMGTPGPTRSSGLCYGVTRQGVELRNLYVFYENATRERDVVLDKIHASMHLPAGRVPPEALLWPEMDGAPTVVVANKRRNDGLYFSRITVDQLLAGLERLRFPAPITAFLRERRALFAHHLFDLGYDYGICEDQVVPRKGSFYGLL